MSRLKIPHSGAFLYIQHCALVCAVRTAITIFAVVAVYVFGTWAGMHFCAYACTFVANAIAFAVF